MESDNTASPALSDLPIKSQVTQAKIEADRQRTEELLAKRQKEHEERMRFKHATQLEKEALLKEIHVLKSSADPHVLLNKSEQLALLSAGSLPSSLPLPSLM